MPFAATLARETRLIADHLNSVPHGEKISYRELTELIGSDIRDQRHCLYAARQMALHETGAAFDTVRGQGLKRLKAEEIPGLGTATRKRVRLSARRTRQIMTRAMQGFNDVDPAVRRQQLAEAAVLALTETLARDRIARRLEARPNPLSVADTAKVLLRLIG